jgi:hypothetical protein
MNLVPSIGVFGFPKSGNNLANKIVNAIRAKSDEKINVYDIHVALRSNSHIPKHKSLDYVVYKSHASAPLYGALSPHDLKAAGIGVGNTEKSLLITRNPIDVLFSFINFRRLQSIKRRSVFDTSKFIRQYLGLSGANDYSFFCENATYENLLERGCLKKAFHAFSVNGLSIPDLYGISGTWPSHLLSWVSAGHSPSKFLRIRYEDIFLNPAFVAASVSEFLSVEESELHDAISLVNSSAKSDSSSTDSHESTSSNKPSFVNKVMPYYSLQYIEKSLIANFATRHHGLLRACGYDDFLDMLTSMQ